MKRIDISPAFVAFLCAYYYFDPLGTFTPYLLSAALHEAGHLAALLFCEGEIHSIHLRMTGTVIKTAPLSYAQELIVALCGPLANILLFYTFRGRVELMVFVNFCLLAYNCLPLYPLDGGRCLRALLHILLPQRIAEALTKTLSSLCLLAIICISCYLTCVWHAGLWPILVSAALLLRLGEMFLKEKQNFAYL